MGSPGNGRQKRELVALRAWYFLYFAGQYAQNFLPLVFSQTMSFTPTEIGRLIGLRRIVKMICGPIFTYVCDCTRAHRPLLLTALVSFYTLTVILCSQRGLLAISITLAVREMVSSGADSTVNAAAIATLAEHNNGTTYGSLRLYGSIGWGMMSFFGSLLLDSFFQSDMRFTLYSQAVIGLGVVFVVLRFLNLSPKLFVAAAERNRVAAEEAELTSLRAGNGTSEVLAWCAEVAMFIANVIMVGFCAGLLQTSIFIYLTTLGVPNSIMGLSIMLNCTVEAICFRFHAFISNMLGGREVAFRIAIVANTLNFIALSNIHHTQNPGAAYVACMTFGGVSYALFWASGVQIASALAPPGKETSAQGVLSSLNWGCGASLGSVVAGVGMQTIGTHNMYMVVGVVQFAVLVVPLAILRGTKMTKNMTGYEEIVS